MIHSELGKLMDGQSLSFEEMKNCMDLIMEGKCTPVLISSFLTALRCKGESIEEIAAAVTTLREKATKIPTVKSDVIDTCGTGGDHSGSFNISTTSAIVAAAAGIPVAKHGNKAMSSSCGSANVLQELGLNLDLTAEQVGQSIDKNNIGFLFAMNLHSAMRHVGPIRQELKQRTLFNILGPMLNPANAKRQVIGVFDFKFGPIMAEVLNKLGSEKVMVVCGEDGLDEISLSAKTHVVELDAGKISQYTLEPADLKLEACTLEELKGGTPEENAKIIKDILDGKQGAKRNIVLANAGAAIYVSGKASSILEGVEQAKEAIDSGKAKETLKKFVEFSH